MENNSLPTAAFIHEAAVDLGRRGRKKGGIARAASLSPERRREIAKIAANTRWNKVPEWTKKRKVNYEQMINDLRDQLVDIQKEKAKLERRKIKITKTISGLIELNLKD